MPSALRTPFVHALTALRTFIIDHAFGPYDLVHAFWPVDLLPCLRAN